MKNINPSLSLLVALCARSVVFGASVGDALAIAAAAGLYGYWLYLESKKELPVNEQVREEIQELRGAINALKISKSLGR